MRIRVPVANFTDHINKWQKAIWSDFYKTREKIHRRAMVWHRRARKTTFDINLLINEASTEKNNTYNYIGPTFRQAKEIIWRDPMMLKRYLPRELLKKSFNESELYGEFKTGSILNVGGADNPDRWRGTGGKGWILDEFAVMRNGDELIEQIIEPIIRDNDGWLLLSFTPKGRNHGWKYWQIAKERDGWEGYFLPANTSNLISPADLKSIREELPERIYEQEYLCKFLAAGGGIIPNPRNCIQGGLLNPKPNRRYVIGVDLGKKEDWTVLTVLNRETRHVDGWQRFSRIGWDFQKERIAILAEKYNNALLCVDSTGVGDPIVDDLKRLGVSVAPYQFTSKSKRRLIEKLIVAIEGRHVTYPDIEDMINELEDFDIDERGRYGAPPGSHDDCVISLALAVEGAGGGVFKHVRDPKTERARAYKEKELIKKMKNAGFA